MNEVQGALEVENEGTGIDCVLLVPLEKEIAELQIEIRKLRHFQALVEKMGARVYEIQEEIDRRQIGKPWALLVLDYEDAIDAEQGALGKMVWAKRDEDNARFRVLAQATIDGKNPETRELQAKIALLDSEEYQRLEAEAIGSTLAYDQAVLYRRQMERTMSFMEGVLRATGGEGAWGDDAATE